MTTIAHPPPQLELPGVAFFGRTLSEYCQFFSLDLRALRGQSVLDVAAGPASFTAEACRKGIDAVAVDPLYGRSHGVLSKQVSGDYDRMTTQIRAKPSLFKKRYFSSFDEAELSRRTAADRFLTDYEAHQNHGRYYGAGLPLLPFLDKTFDLVLCAHFLFVYGGQFDFEFHLAACRELVRVSREEVRIHPLVGLGGKKYPELPRLRALLAEEHIASEVVPVDYEFFAGTNTMLVLRREAVAAGNVTPIILSSGAPEPVGEMVCA